MTAAIRVLYVDDESDLLEIGRLFLEHSGNFTVTTALSAADGIHLLGQEKFDAIVSDYQMPGMDGIQFLVEVRTRFGPIPFILFTGRGREEVVIQALNSGADFYLQKGGEPEAQFAELAHKIKKAVEGRRAEEADRASRDRLISSDADLRSHKTELESQAEELRRAKLALEESRDKYLDLYDFAPLGYLTLSDKALITSMNLTGAKLLGVERNRLDKARFSKFVADKDADGWRGYFLNLLNQQEKKSCTLMLTRRGGPSFPARLEGIRITGSDGTNTVRIAFTDISDIRHAEETLRDSEEKFRTLAESSPDYIMRYDRKCRHTYMNPAALRASGLTERQIIGKTHRESGFDETQSHFYEDKILGVFETGKPFQTQFAWDSAEGRVVLDWMLTPEFSKEGTVRSVLGVSRDITQLKKAEDELLRKSEELHASYEEIASTEEELRHNVDELTRQEQALRESEANLRAILDATPFPVALVDLQDNNINYWSRSALTLFGHTAPTAAEWYQLAYPDPGYRQDVIDRWKPYLEKAKLSGQPVNTGEYQVTCRDNSVRTCELYATFLEDKLVVTFNDITKRKRTERELLSAYDQLKEAHRLAHIGTWDWVIETDTVTWSEELCNISGWDPSRPAPTYAELPRIYTPASWERLSAAVANALTTGEPYNLELELIRPDGSMRWTHAFGGVVCDTTGKVTGLHGTVQDITESKRAEEVLAETNAYLNNLFDYANAPIIVWDPDFVITRFNHAFEDLTLISAQEIIGQRLDILFPKESRDISLIQIKKTLEGERWEIVEIPILVKDGSVRTVLWNSANILDPDGRIISTIAQGVDITEGKRGEAALAESFATFSTVMDSLDALVYAADMKTHEILFVNQYGRKIWGDLTGKICWKSLQVNQQGPCPFCTNERLLDKDGNPAGIVIWEFKNTINGHWYECHDSAIRWTDGRIVRIEIATDITDRKQADEMRRGSEERFQGIFDTITSGVAIYEVRNNGASGKDYIIRDFNKTALEIEGKKKDEVIGKSLFDLRPAIDDYGLIPVFQQVWETGVPADFPQKVYIDEKYSSWYENRVFRLQSGEIVAVYDDVTERKRAEEALRESEQKLSSILNNITDVVWSLSWPDLKVHYISPSAEQVYGRPVQEFIDRPSLWAEIVHPDDRYLSEKALEDLQNSGSAMRECRIVRPDGSIVWIHDRSKFIYDVHGTPVRVEGITSDITGRKRVLESLAESESFNRNLVENLPEYIAVYGMDGNLLYVNPASARTLGYDAETLIGTHVLSYIAEEYHETVIAKMTVRREGGEASPYEIEMVTRNGPRRSVIVKAAPIQYQENPATLLLLIDITERKQAEEALRQLSDRLSLATRAGGVGIWDYDVVNNTLTWDAQMFALYGITKEQFGGAYEAWQAGLSPEDKQRSDDEVQMALRGEKEFDTEFCVLWPDGSIRNIRAFALVQRDAWGKPIRMIGTNWDISERKELETEMKYHEQELTQFSKSLATANKKLTLLSSITRHDINNQLTVLMGFLAILKKKHSDTFTDEYFQKINAAAERISSMIRFTREYENIGVNAPVWQDCHTLVDTAAKEAPLGKVMVANDLPVGGEVFADQLITKVFYNLMDNAVRYGGKITTIRFSVEDSGDEHLIVCKDDGVGIPVEEKEKIFERGFGKNTGLGLFLSREILDITGITIKETGEPGKGARFEMTVPKGMYR